MVKPSKGDMFQAAMERLAAEHSVISPKIVLEEARNPNSPLHDKFEWDDSTAAENFRLIQAAGLIRQWKGTFVRIEREVEVVKLSDIRMAESPETSRGRGKASYEKLDNILDDPKKRASLLRTVIRQVRSIKLKYEYLEELACVWQALEEVEAGLTAKV